MAAPAALSPCLRVAAAGHVSCLGADTLLISGLSRRPAGGTSGLLWPRCTSLLSPALEACQATKSACNTVAA